MDRFSKALHDADIKPVPLDPGSADCPGRINRLRGLVMPLCTITCARWRLSPSKAALEPAARMAGGEPRCINFLPHSHAESLGTNESAAQTAALGGVTTEKGLS